jgi:hypothetical protein
MSRARNTLLAMVGLVGAYTIGRITTDAPSAAQHSERIIERGPERTIVHERTGAGISLDDVRAVVREELANDKVPAEDTVGDNHADDSRFAVAKTALDTAMSDGRWSETDRSQLRAHLATLSQTESEKLFSVLFPALNAGQLHAEFRGSPI